MGEGRSGKGSHKESQGKQGTQRTLSSIRGHPVVRKMHFCFFLPSRILRLEGTLSLHHRTEVRNPIPVLYLLHTRARGMNMEWAADLKAVRGSPLSPPRT